VQKLTAMITNNKILFITVGLALFIIGFGLALYKAYYPTDRFQQRLRVATYVNQGTTTPINDIDDTLMRIKTQYLPKALTSLQQSKTNGYRQINVEKKHSGLLAFQVYASAHNKQKIQKLLNNVKNQLNEIERPNIELFKEAKSAKLNDIRQIMKARPRLSQILKEQRQNPSDSQLLSLIPELMLVGGFTQNTQVVGLHDIKYETERQLKTITASRFIGQLKAQRVSWSFGTLLGISFIMAILISILTVIIKSYLSEQA
jgi:hypothetical protein